MPSPDYLVANIEQHIASMVGSGLVNDQNFPFRCNLPNGRIEVTYANAPSFSAFRKAKVYEKTYVELRANRGYTMVLLDGAMLQMAYIFHGNDLERDRLAFLPSSRKDGLELHKGCFLAIKLIATIPFP